MTSDYHKNTLKSKKLPVNNIVQYKKKKIILFNTFLRPLLFMRFVAQGSYIK